MRRLIILISTLAIAACTFADAQEGERSSGGRTGTREFNVGSFDAVSLAGAYDVVVTVGPAASVRAEGDAEELERMEIEVEGGDLRIGRKRGERWTFGWKRPSKPVTVYVSAPSLRAADIAGSGNMTIDKVEGRSFSAGIAGSGDMRIALLRVEEARFDVAGSGDISAVGAAREARVSVAGSGDVNLDGFETRTSRVDIVGSGDVRTRTMETADVSIMGSGDVIVLGPAKCSVSKMGSGEVRCQA